MSDFILLLRARVPSLSHLDNAKTLSKLCIYNVVFNRQTLAFLTYLFGNRIERFRRFWLRYEKLISTYAVKTFHWSRCGGGQRFIRSLLLILYDSEVESFCSPSLFEPLNKRRRNTLYFSHCTFFSSVKKRIKGLSKNQSNEKKINSTTLPRKPRKLLSIKGGVEKLFGKTSNWFAVQNTV